MFLKVPDSLEGAFRTPNDSLKLTRRAVPQLLLASPAYKP
jgi:hypothetical protein